MNHRPVIATTRYVGHTRGCEVYEWITSKRIPPGPLITTHHYHARTIFGWRRFLPCEML